MVTTEQQQQRQQQQRLCRKILSVNRSIRFAGIADGSGKVAASAYRDGLSPLLTEQESEMSITQSTICMLIRRSHEEKMGGLVYSATVYGKVKRATVPLRGGLALMVSFDADAEHDRLLVGGIIPLLQKEGMLGSGNVEVVPAR